jgi:hypothetical protein
MRKPRRNHSAAFKARVAIIDLSSTGRGRRGTRNVIVFKGRSTTTEKCATTCALLVPRVNREHWMPGIHQAG